AGLRAYVIGENIMQVVQSNDPARVSVISWMNSPGHRRNVLLPEMKETGVGIWQQGNRYFVTQIYMEPK
ncbi:MAG: CAP domain-containing protein, partial [Acaryochloridaceae cyanobacterium SU_2_1]|nr:CAP domain-containing protein [Acaryochloridaceae cyanobacterium SU_2_1]